jgi:hypothetical protein
VRSLAEAERARAASERSRRDGASETDSDLRKEPTADPENKD